MIASKEKTKEKQHGIHYTPAHLATFLAGVIVDTLPRFPGGFTVLDPACGDGALLSAFCSELPPRRRKKATLIGYETDSVAVNKSKSVLANCGAANVLLEDHDFLDLESLSGERQATFLKEDASKNAPGVDVVIANPPYVRTQVLGAKQAQRLAGRYGLTGRVDLYHAFTIAMAESLKPGGILGLLTSNRFLTIKSGMALRQLLAAKFHLVAVFDLGDTKLFETAAVLPVIVVARKRLDEKRSQPDCAFTRVYEYRENDPPKGKVSPRVCDTLLGAVKDSEVSGLIEVATGKYLIERGTLLLAGPDNVWTLSTPEKNDWLSTIQQHTARSFGDLAFVRVGIKTTADEVFIQDWDTLQYEDCPEDSLLRPLLTHHHAKRWVSDSAISPKRVLYPHEIRVGKRRAVPLDGFPRTKRFFESHKARLTRRKYVLDAGRKWYEIWVPHNPNDWKQPKLVYPDISEFPKFFMDFSGAIVNGDCYWITLRPNVEPEWLYWMLAVANSTFITEYYDTLFYNKLYAGRRRFMTQYVKEFPLPNISSTEAQKAIGLVKKMVSNSNTDNEEQVDRLVWNAFGLSKEECRQ